MGEGIKGLLLPDSPIAKRLGFTPPAADPAEAHRREARRLLAGALDEAVYGAGSQGAAIDVRRTATAAELQADAEAKTKAKAEREASIARQKQLEGEAAELAKQIKSTEQKLRAAEGEAMRADRAASIAREEARIRDRRASRGKRALSPQELRRRAVETVQKGGR